MEIYNSEEKYGLPAKFFHWTIAVLILGLIPVGLFMDGMENSPLKFEVFALHKSFGLLVFFLGLGRIVWRFVSPPPDHLETHAHWEVTLAGAAHFWLYVCIIGMPLTGWLMSSAGEFPVPFFGLQMPHIIGKDEGLGRLFGQAHGILAYTLLFVLGLHIAGALKHHVLDKDETLMRMAWYREGMVLPALIVIVAGASFGASALMIGQKYFAAPGAIESAEDVIAAAPPSPAVDTAGLAEHGWAIDPARSKLQFEAVLYNAPFTGTLGDFGGEIVFNPQDLSTARADIRIGMKDVATGDSDRDGSIQGTDWFDTAQFPDARFVAQKFEHADGNKYVAIGDVTIKGVTMPLLIPFTLDITNAPDGRKTAHMRAEVSLDRTHFNIGTAGQWATDTSVGKDVRVLIDLSAVQ